MLPNFSIVTSVLLTNSTSSNTFNNIIQNIIDLMSMMSMSEAATILFFTTGPRVTAGEVAEQEHRECDRTSQQDTCVE